MNSCHHWVIQFSCFLTELDSVDTSSSMYAVFGQKRSQCFPR